MQAGGATDSHVCAKDTVKVPPFASKISDSPLFSPQALLSYSHVITSERKTLSPKIVDAFQNLPKPITIFLVCPPLIHGKGPHAKHKIKWTLEVEQSFTELKLTLPDLSLRQEMKKIDV